MPTMRLMRKTSRTQPAKMVTIRIPHNTRQLLKLIAARDGGTIGRLVTQLADARRMRDGLDGLS